MHRRCAALGLALLALAWAAGLSAADPGKWTPAETLSYRPVSDVQVSPDGSRSAYVVREPVMENDKSEFRTQIWLSSTDGKSSRKLTSAETPSNRPRWSPNGEWIALLSKRGDKFMNIWLLPSRGGEAQRLTDSRSDVSQFSWSPDSQWIAFVAAEPPAAEKEKRDREKDDARVVDEDERPGRLWLTGVSSDASARHELRKLVSVTGSIGGNPEGAVSDELDWSPDGRTIAFSHTKAPKADAWPTSDISLVDVVTGAVRPLAATGASETSPRYSPDGRWIAFVATDDPPRWARKAGIRVAPAEGGPARELPASFDEQPELAGWSADGKTILFGEPRGVFDLVYAQSVETGSIRALSEVGKVSTGVTLNSRGTWIGFVRQTPTDPSEAWVSAVSPFSPVRISSVNASLPKFPLGETRVISWTGDKGETIEGLLTLPVGYVPGRRYPTLLVVHGGPAGVFKATYLAAPSAYSVAVFSAEGYAVLRANPRGSSGYGAAFRRGNEKDWGGGDFRDLMAGVDKVIEMGVADPDRLGVMGWSYGGFMTSWIITQTDRFKAASVGAGVTNLVSFNGTADIPSFVPDYFGGEFWDEGVFEVYRSHSAMGHVDKVKTPTLIQHGEADVRVPISQGYELYNALKRRGVPVKMVVYPRQPHTPREPRLIRDVEERNLAWMEKWVKGGGK